MATQITTLTAGYLFIQAGHGIPNHVAPKGSQFTDIDTAILYFNKDGLSDWEPNIDVTNSGTTVAINTFSSFSSTTIGQGSVIATTSSDNLSYSGINLSILVDNTNKILTLSATTPSNYTFTGGTVNELIATSVSATTYYNLPTDIRLTGGTYNNGVTTFTNNTGGTFTVSGYKTDDTFVTGGTYNNGTATFTNNTGGTFSVSGFKTSEIFVTGGTYSNSTGVTTFTNNTGGTFTVSGYFKPTDDIYTTGMTFNPSTYDLSIGRNDGTSFSQNLGILATDMTITGGTYDVNTGVASFTNNTGGTFNVSGFLTGMTDTYTTGFTYSNNTLTLKRNAGQPDLSVLIDTMSGLTVNGIISATTISATTFYGNGSNLTGLVTQDTFVTGGTYSSGSATFTNNTGGTFNVSGFFTSTDDVYTTGMTFNNNVLTIKQTNNQSDVNILVDNFSGLTVNGSISATTYYGNGTYLTGLVTQDTVVTGGTYNSGSILFTNNTGGTFNVSGLYTGVTLGTYLTGATYSNNVITFFTDLGAASSVTINTMTGLTVNGNLVISGNSALNGGITSTSYTGTTNRMVESSTGGTVTATKQIISGYITDSTIISYLTTAGNWTINGSYIGTTITGVYQGQNYYDDNYLYTFVADNLPIRLIRG